MLLQLPFLQKINVILKIKFFLELVHLEQILVCFWYLVAL